VKNTDFYFSPWNFSWNRPSWRSKGQSGSAKVHQAACDRQGLRGCLLQGQLSLAGSCRKNSDSGQPGICHELGPSSFTAACWSPSPLHIPFLKDRDVEMEFYCLTSFRTSEQQSLHNLPQMKQMLCSSWDDFLFSFFLLKSWRKHHSHEVNPQIFCNRHQAQQPSQLCSGAPRWTSTTGLLFPPTIINIRRFSSHQARGSNAEQA